MAGFDPDKYLAEKTGKAFDPDKYLAEKTGSPFNPDAYLAAKNPPMSAGQAAAVKGEEGLTFGLRPVVAGAGSVIGQLLGRSWNQNDTLSKEITSAFSEGRKGAIDEQNKAQEDHPRIATAATIAGNLVSSPFLPPVTSVGKAAAVGAGLGAAQAAGSAQSPEEALKDVGLGGAAGAAGYGVAKTVGTLAANKLNDLAETKAFKASGAMLKDFRAAFNRDPEKINELGRTMLDNDLVKAGDTVASIAQKADIARRQTGQEIGQVYNKVLDELTKPESNIPLDKILEVQKAGFHPELQAEEMKALVAKELKGIPGSTSAMTKANQVIDELAANGNDLTPDHALELKGHVDAMINWSKKAQDLPLEQDALKKIRGFIQDKLDAQVSALDSVLGSNQSKSLTSLNKLYGNLATISNIAKDRAFRDSANRPIGLTDTIAGAGGMGAGAALTHTLMPGEHGLLPYALTVGGGIAAGAANKAARTYGPAAVADLANQAAGAAANPNTFSPTLSTIARLKALQPQSTNKKK